MNSWRTLWGAFRTVFVWSLAALLLLVAVIFVFTFIAAVLEPQPTTVTCTGSMYSVTCERS